MEDVKSVPDGAVLVLSAHGNSPTVFDEARAKHLRIIDATCPLVTKVHWEAKRAIKDGYFVIYVGHSAHPETIGVLAEMQNGAFALVEDTEGAEKLQIAEESSKKLILLNQTTLSVDDIAEIRGILKRKYSALSFPPASDICYATQNRQAAVRGLVKMADVVLVVGSEISSNSLRLRDLAERLGRRSYLVGGEGDVKSEMLDDCKTLGITAGASSPEDLVQKIVDKISQKYGGLVKELRVMEEDISFPILPTIEGKYT